MRVLGLDGCPGGWAGALVEQRTTGAAGAVAASVELKRYDGWDLREPLAEDVDLVAVDIPVGLPALGQPRTAETAARALLGVRRSSVFPAPPRELLGYASHAETVTVARALTGRGISIQAFNIYGRIAAVDASVTPADQTRLVEVHPELAWLALAGRDLGSKRHAAGRDAREEVIRRVWDVSPRLPGAKRDDVLDALVCAWTAQRWLAGEAQLLPDAPERDPRGLLMAITA